MPDNHDEGRDRRKAANGPFSTDPELEPEPLYGPESTREIDYEREIGYPGEPPFTRGIQPTMYRGRYWTMRQYAGFGTAAQTNARFRYLLEQGQTGLSVAFDLPTQMGYDSDDPMAQGEVGRSGVAIDSLDDMQALLEGVPLEKVSTSMTINATAATLLCLYMAVARRQGVPFASLSGTIQNDILKEYAARGTYIYPPRPSMRLVTDSFAFCTQRLERWNPISVSGYHMREAGCTAVQEVAFTLANGLAYLEAGRAAGVSPDVLAPRMSFFFNTHSNLFEEVAKFRAARRLWARLLKERFALTRPRALMLRFHAQTAGSSLTAQQPENNIVRVAIQTLAAVLGGTQSLHTNSMDEALSLPTQRSATIALRTQQIVAEESGVANTIDPVAGSYFIEALTSRIESKARRAIETIDKQGGAVRAVESGYIQRQIQEAAYRYQVEIEQGRRVVVGVNRFREERDGKIPTHRHDPDRERDQVRRVRELRRRRDASRCRAALERLERVARTDENLLPVILEAVESLATVGEIAGRLRRVFGAHDRA
ncbi:MAG: methylmalonyl-CoA mutase [Acidobacteriota bacterium]